MIFALKLTLVLHSGLQSVMLFIFHMFGIHTDLFSLSLSIIYRFVPYTFYFLTPYPSLNLCQCKEARTAHEGTGAPTPTHCKHDVHTLITQSINPLFFPPFSTSCVFSLSTVLTSTLSLLHNRCARRNTHKRANARKHEHTR